MMVQALYDHCCGSDDGQRMGCVRARLGGAGEAGSWLQVLAEAAARSGPGAHIAVLARGHDTLLPEHQARQPDHIFFRISEIFLLHLLPLMCDLLDHDRLQHGSVAQPGAARPAQPRVRCNTGQ